MEDLNSTFVIVVLATVGGVVFSARYFNLRGRNLAITLIPTGGIAFVLGLATKVSFESGAAMVIIAALLGYFPGEILRGSGRMLMHLGEGTARGAGQGIERLLRAVLPWIVGTIFLLCLAKYDEKLFTSIVSLAILGGIAYALFFRRKSPGKKTP